MAAIKDWVAAHRKVLLPAISGLLILFIDQETVDIIIGGIGIVLTYLVPNDPAAVERVYHRKEELV